MSTAEKEKSNNAVFYTFVGIIGLSLVLIVGYVIYSLIFG